jgi:hypothetical protein
MDRNVSVEGKEEFWAELFAIIVRYEERNYQPPRGIENGTNEGHPRERRTMTMISSK